MKKALLLLASAAMLLVGCAKEKFAEPNDGGLTSVTFSASVDGGVATKAFADGDGKGTNVNRCIMEIYFQDQLYKRMEAAMSGTPATTTFANVPVVAGREYQILFWADHVDVVNTEAGLATDKYYTTKTTTDNKGLKAVTVNKTNFIDALKNKKNDELDAFFFAGNYTVPQNLTQPFNVSLKRPFAQLNVITTDVAEGKTVTSADLLPDKVSVSYKAANKINVSTGEISQVGEVADYTYTYEAPVYGVWSDTKSELTLSMDYILAPATEQGAVDVTFVTRNGGQPVMTHNLTNLPYQRNYRTNVKGDLLTVAGSWTATINPIWSSPDIVKVVEVADIKSANQIINQYASTTANLEVKFVGVPNDSGVPSGSEGSQYRAIRTTPLQEGANLGIEVMTSTNTLYVGDYIYEYKVTGGTVDEYIDNTAKQATVNINVPADSGIGTLIINAPTKSVYINGKEVANVGTITDLDAITSQNTLIIEKDQTVGTLTIRQGGLEIHGTVGEAIVPDVHGQIQVRDCENLDETKVYDVLEPHIAEGYVGVKDRTTVGKWDIVPIVCKIGEIGYGSLADAVAAVPANTETTITMVANHEILGNAGVTIAANQNIILDLAGYTVKNLVNESNASQLITNNGTLKIIGNGTLTNALADGVIPGDWPTHNYVTNLISNLGTLTIENGTFINTQDSGITYTLDNNSNVVNAIATINGGTFKSVGNSAVRMFCNSTTAANTLTINDGYFEGHYYAVSVSNAGNGSENTKVGTLNINGGEFESLDETENYNVCIANWVSNKSSNISVNITSGKFNDYVCIASKASITGGLFKYAVYTDPDDGTQYKLADYVAEGYAVVANTDATTKAQYPWAVDRKGVAKIGTTIYYDLKDAIDAVPAGTETETMITMLDNVAGTATFTIPSNKNICLELNGKSIYASSTTATNFALFANKGIFTVQDNTDTHKDGTGTGKLSTIAYDPDMKPVPGYATNTITNYGTLNIKSGLIESGSEGKASYAIDNEAENAQWNNSSNKTITLNVSGGRIVAGASYSIRMYLATSGQYDNIINIDNAHIGSLWVQDNDGATAAKGTLTISNSTFENNLLVGYECYSEHFSLNVSNSVFGGKFHYQLDSEVEGNTISIDDISAAPFFMDTPKKVLHNGTVTIKGEFSYGWVYVEDENKKTELEAAGWRLESDPNYTTWFHGYLTEAGILNYLKDCIEDGYEAVCVDQTAGKYEIKAK